MKKASIPFQVENQKLYVPPVAWPLRCPCCGREETTNEVELNHMAQYQRTVTTRSSSSSGYPLAWQIPYCQHCASHAKSASNITPTMLVIGVILTLVFGIVVGEIVPILLLIVGLVIAGAVVYQILLRTMILPRLSDTCSTPHYAVQVSDQDNQVRFHFHNDAYAEQFALVNQLEVVDDDSPPRLIAGMKWK